MCMSNFVEVNVNFIKNYLILIKITIFTLKYKKMRYNIMVKEKEV